MSEFTNDSFSVETSRRDSGEAASTDGADLMCTPHSTHWTTNFKLEGSIFPVQSFQSTPTFQESRLFSFLHLVVLNLKFEKSLGLWESNKSEH